MARFILNNSNIRHRFFLNQLVYYYAEKEGDWKSASLVADQFVEDSYEIVDKIISQTNMSDPKTLVYLKSFLGPIEDFISPQVQSRLRKILPG